MPPLREREREAAIDELVRIAERFPGEEFERDVRPRLERLSPEQYAIVEQGLLMLLAMVEETDTRRVSERLLDLLVFVGTRLDRLGRAPPAQRPGRAAVPPGGQAMSAWPPLAASFLDSTELAAYCPDGWLPRRWVSWAASQTPDVGRTTAQQDFLLAQLRAGARLEDMPALHAQSGAAPHTPELWREWADELKARLLARGA